MEIIIPYVSPYLDVSDLITLTQVNKELREYLFYNYKRINSLLSTVTSKNEKLQAGNGLCQGALFLPRPSQMLPNRSYEILKIHNMYYTFRELIHFSLTLYFEKENYLTIWKNGYSFSWGTIEEFSNFYDVQILINGKQTLYEESIQEIAVLIRKR
jgi:hypothetical protein